jgi:hypothetical protein
VEQPFPKAIVARAIPSDSTDVEDMVFTVISVGIKAMPL